MTSFVVMRDQSVEAQLLEVMALVVREGEVFVPMKAILFFRCTTSIALMKHSTSPGERCSQRGEVEGAPHVGQGCFGAGGPAFEKVLTFRVADPSWVSRGRDFDFSIDL
jgi:hypothetical protein